MGVAGKSRSTTGSTRRRTSRTALRSRSAEGGAAGDARAIGTARDARREASIVRRSSRPLVAAALVGTVATVVVGPPIGTLAALRGAPPGTETSVSDGTDASAGAPDRTMPGRRSTEPTAPVTDPPALEEVRATWRVSGGTEEAAALGVVVARRTVTRDGDRPAFAVLEAVERPAGDAVVVTVLVETDDGTLERIAVPIALDPTGARLAGPPWRLPPPELTFLRPSTTPIDDARLLESAREALERVGRTGTGLTLGRTTSWPVVARFETERGIEELWLRWHLDRFVVAGLPLDRSGLVADPARDGSLSSDRPEVRP